MIIHQSSIKISVLSWSSYLLRLRECKAFIRWVTSASITTRGLPYSHQRFCIFQMNVKVSQNWCTFSYQYPGEGYIWRLTWYASNRGRQIQMAQKFFQEMLVTLKVFYSCIQNQQPRGFARDWNKFYLKLLLFLKSYVPQNFLIVETVNFWNDSNLKQFHASTSSVSKFTREHTTFCNEVCRELVKPEHILDKDDCVQTLEFIAILLFLEPYPMFFKHRRTVLLLCSESHTISC